ncbi:anti-sigma factor, partial [Pseudomonas proteolytica]|nr:RNA polymerase subunit sigma-70 [Pseudomonas proteolytica]
MTPEELNDLAGEYVLGTLAAEQRLHVQQRLEHDAPLRAAVEAWEQRLLPLTELAEPVAPSPYLWRRIERSLGHHAVGETPPVPWWNLLALWRG